MTRCAACGQPYALKARSQMKNAQCPIAIAHVWIVPRG
jgi:hypothetical protein